MTALDFHFVSHTLGALLCLVMVFWRGVQGRLFWYVVWAIALVVMLVTL